MPTVASWLWLVGWLAVVGGTERPVVGVLSQELPQQIQPLFPGKHSYIPAAYVKAVEASGARVAPIFINRTTEYYRQVISSINGILLPGGDTIFTTPGGYGETGRIILELVQQLQDSGVSVPVLGVCQGFELLMFLASQTTTEFDILVACKSFSSALPLRFRPGFRDSRLYRLASPEIIDILQTLDSTANHHRWCVTEPKMQKFHLEKQWRVLSTNLDSQGLEFVSSGEHFQRPIAGVQFHPEKNMYEWNITQNNPHSRKAILSNRLFYDWLAAESRANNQSFPGLEEEQEALIYNYSPVYTGKDHGYDEQVYFFQ